MGTIEGALDDVRIAARRLRHSPGFVLTGVVTLALAIGVNTAVFSVVNALWLRPSPVPQPEQVVLFYEEVRQSTGAWVLIRDDQSWQSFERFQDPSRAFLGVAAEAVTDQVTVALPGSPPLAASPVSHNYFRVLGVAVRGPGFAVDDDEPGARIAVVLSDHIWRSRFGGDEMVVGRTIHLTGRPAIVVGIAAPGFRGPRLGDRNDIWLSRHAAMMFLPMPQAAAFQLRRVLLRLRLYGRLRPGAQFLQAQAEARQVIGPRVRLTTLADTPYPIGSQASAGGDRRLMSLLGVASLVVLLAGCANLTALLLARAEGRRHEIAARAAIGASRARLARLLASEVLVLSLLGALPAILISRLLLNVLTAFSLPTGVELSALALDVDWRVAGFTTVLSLVTIAVCGVVPGWRASRTQVIQLLSGAHQSGRRPSGRARHVLLVGYVALTFTLLIGAGLLTRSVRNAQTTDVGLDHSRTVFVKVAPDFASYTTDATHGRVDSTRWVTDVLRLDDRLRSLPGVEAVARGVSPFRTPTTVPPVETEVVTHAVAHRLPLGIVWGGPNYCSVVGIPLSAGRDLADRDFAEGGQRVAIVGQALANILWPGENPIGMRFSWVVGSSLRHVPGYETSDIVVVGVARDSLRNGVRARTSPTLYLADLRVPDGVGRIFVGVVLRTNSSASRLVPAITAAVRDVFPKAMTLEVTTVEQMIDREMMSERMGATLFCWFGFVALALAAVGVWGLIASLVAERTYEIGVRLALGATPGRLVTRWTLHGILPVIAGCIAGLGIAASTTRLLSAYLFEVSPVDLATFAGSWLLLVTVAAAASFLPARRVLRIDPAVVLRDA